MVNSKTKVKNRQLLRSRITQQRLLSISKITPGSGRVDGSPDCAEKHKGSSNTAITTSRQNTLLAHLAISSAHIQYLAHVYMFPALPPIRNHTFCACVSEQIRLRKFSKSDKKIAPGTLYLTYCTICRVANIIMVQWNLTTLCISTDAARFPSR